MYRVLWIILPWLIALPACTGQDSQTSPNHPPDSLINASLFTDPDSNFIGLEELDSRDRENWQKPQMVITRLGDLSDKVVADIGAGTGYFTMRLARKARRVVAIDIEQQFLDYINRRVERTPSSERLQVETRLTQPNDPSLRPEEADLVLLINTYSFIADRVDYFSKVHSGVAEGGRLVIVDFRKEPLPVGPPPEEKLHWDQIFLELDSAGFSRLEVDTTGLDYQYTVTAHR
ncbi:MAG: class I SAM-dependent methyltransferase [Bacteroidota bacterium]